ncbi:hypothetical protein C8F01DRAFT_1250557 [Mycena amicta]|nr:hypothetical protein C8F01DRAFT_1250557 [Mycena amicta]
MSTSFLPSKISSVSDVPILQRQGAVDDYHRAANKHHSRRPPYPRTLRDRRGARVLFLTRCASLPIAHPAPATARGNTKPPSLFVTIVPSSILSTLWNLKATPTDVKLFLPPNISMGSFSASVHNEQSSQVANAFSVAKSYGTNLIVHLYHDPTHASKANILQFHGTFGARSLDVD